LQVAIPRLLLAPIRTTTPSVCAFGANCHPVDFADGKPLFEVARGDGRGKYCPLKIGNIRSGIPFSNPRQPSADTAATRAKCNKRQKKDRIEALMYYHFINKQISKGGNNAIV
jgi:hypothetical protein